MADPLTGFGAAAGALQFVEAGIKLLLKTREVYKSTSGLSDEHESLQTIMSNLQSLNAEIEQTHGSQISNLAAQNVYSANQECLDLSKEFLQLLGTLKRESGQHKGLRSLTLAAKSFWNQGTLRRLEARLVHSRDNLMLSLLGLLKRQNEDLAARAATSSTTLQAHLTLWLQQHTSPLQPHSDDRGATNAAGLRDLLAYLSQCTQSQNFNQSLQPRQGNGHHLAELDAVERNIRSLAALQERSSLKLVQSLYFFELDGWQNHIEPAHRDTFRWIMDEELHGSQTQPSFLQWLEDVDGQNLYWLHGKPGSGKSTMMRYIHYSLRRLERLTGWMAHSKLIQANVFLWHGSSTIQRSIFGLLRSLLYQIWREIPDVVSDAVTEQRWASALHLGYEMEPWTAGELQEAFTKTLQLVANTTAENAKFLILIDGLDEYEGADREQQALIDLLKSASSHSCVKVCVTSRHSVVHKDAFDACPQLCLESMTGGDMRTYVRDTLCSNNHYQKVQRRAPEITESVVSELVGKSKGVFLFVSLAVRDILKVVRDGGGTVQVSNALRNLHLQHYYTRLLEKIPTEYRRDASIILQIALYDVSFTPNYHPKLGTGNGSADERPRLIAGPCLLLLYLRHLDDDSQPHFATDSEFESLDLANDEEIDYWLEILERRVASRCMGLLEITFPAETESPKWNTLVTFLHRSVKDFLTMPNVQTLLHEWSDGPYDVHAFRCHTIAADIVNFSNPAIFEELHILRLYAFSCFMSMITNGTTRCADPQPYWQLLDWLLPQIRLDSDEWCRLNSGARIGISDVLLDVTGRWREDHSDPLSLAVAFGWQSYVEAKTSSKSECERTGRPLLDYALRPCRNRPCAPYPGIVEHLLQWESNPNELYNGASVWVHYIVSLIALRAESEDAHSRTVQLLLSSIASRAIPLSQLIIALKRLCIERSLKPNKMPDLVNALQRFEPLRVDGNGDVVYDVFHVLDVVAEHAIALREDCLALDNKSHISPEAGGEEDQHYVERSQREVSQTLPPERTVYAGTTLTANGHPSRTSQKSKSRIKLRPSTPEPKCGYDQRVKVVSTTIT